MITLAMYSPMPVPEAGPLVVKYGSKMCGNADRGMPPPLSLIESTDRPASPARLTLIQRPTGLRFVMVAAWPGSYPPQNFSQRVMMISKAISRMMIHSRRAERRAWDRLVKTSFTSSRVSDLCLISW